MSDGYNGWSNRATWLVNVWYNPESRQDVLDAKADLEEQYNEIRSVCIRDMCSLFEVNWRELEECFEDGAEKEDDA